MSLCDTPVDIADIDEIRFGQTTANFAKHPAPDLAKSSFSVIYAQGKSTLDLIAKDPNEFKIWTRGIIELVKISKNGRIGDLERLKALPLDLGILPNRRSSQEIVDARTGSHAEDLIDDEKTAAAPVKGSTLRRQNSSGAAPWNDEDEYTQGGRDRATSTGNKQMYKEVAKNFQTLKHKLAKRKEELRAQHYYMSQQYPSMQAIVKKVQESVNKVTELFQNGEYALCDDEIWRAGVDLESLKNMMRAVIKP